MSERSDTECDTEHVSKRQKVDIVRIPSPERESVEQRQSFDEADATIERVNETDTVESIPTSADHVTSEVVPATSEPSASADSSPYDFVKYFDASSGHFYYYNWRTGESTWTQPENFIESVASSSGYGTVQGGYYGGMTAGMDAYTSQASFNSRTGSFAVAGTDSYWEMVRSVSACDMCNIEVMKCRACCRKGGLTIAKDVRCLRSLISLL